MPEPTTNIGCSHCGALLKGAGKRTIVTCEFCGTEQSLRPNDREDEEEHDEDAPDSVPWDEDKGGDEAESEPDDEGKPLENADCIERLHRHVEEVGDLYDAEEIVIEVDEENTDDDRAYLYLKDAEGEVLDYFFVDRDDGTLELYDYDAEQWDEV